MNKNSKIKMALTESVNVFRLNKVIGLYPHLRNDFDIFNDNDNGEQYYKTLLPILQTYLQGINLINNDIGWRRVDYIPPKTKKSEDDGVKRRLYPKKAIGLVSFPRDIRDYLLHDNHNQPLVVDFDIQNCHPVIYYQWLLRSGYSENKLQLFKDYIDHRKNWFDIYGQDIKRYIISVINGAQQLTFENENISEEDFEKLDCLVREIWKTHDWIQEKYQLDGLVELKDFIFKKNTEIEAQIVDIAMEFARDFSKSETITSIYAYDGFAVHRRGVFKKPEQVDKFLALLNQKIYEETGYKCVFVDKPLKVNPKLQEFLDNTHIDTPVNRTYDIKLENGQFLSDIITQNIFEDFPEDILVLKSGMGDGKTALGMKCIQQLRAQGKHITTISVLNRISLIDNLKHDYPFMFSYREDGTIGEIHGVGKSVVVCCESLYRLTLATKQQCDFLILDEVMSLLPQMTCSDTHGKHLKMNQQILLGLIKSVKKIIILDANVSEQTIDFIKSIRQKSEIGTTNVEVKQWSVAPRRPRNIYYDTNITSRMVDSLTTGKRLFVPCTRSIKFGEGTIRELRQRFPDKKMVYINSETKGEADISELLRDTSLWGNYDLVMISPCISTGVSCVLRDAFDEVFCFFSPSSTNPLDASQQIGRVRYPTTNNIYIEISQNGNPTYRFGARTKDQVLKMIYNNTHNLYKDNSHLVDTEFNYTNFKETLQRTPRTELFLFNYSEQSRLYSDYRAHLRTALENTYICNFTYDNEQLTDIEGQFRKSAKEHGLQYLNEKATGIFNSPNLSTDEYSYLEMKQKKGVELSKQDLYTIDKYWLGVNTKIQLSGIDKFVQNHPTRTPRVLFKVLNSKACAVVKPLNRFIKNLKGVGPESDNSQFLEKLFDPVQFNLNDFKEEENITTKWLTETHNGTMLKYIWAEKVLKLFGARNLWDAISLTDEQFKTGFVKFVDWLKLLCVPLNHGVFNFNRIMDLFNLTELGGGQYTLKTLGKISSNSKAKTSDFKPIINQILRPIGLSFRSERKQKQVKGVRTSTQITTLQLNYPVLLNYYLEPEPDSYITTKKGHLILDKDTIPVLTSGSSRLNLSETWIELYQSSVFYHLPQIQCSLDDEDQAKDQVDKQDE